MSAAQKAQKAALPRCSWAESDPVIRAYHDNEWGVPLRDSRALWETLMLEGFQAGLSWAIILRRRTAFREAFQGFDPEIVTRFGQEEIARLVENPGIIRSRAKIEAMIGGARLSGDGPKWRGFRGVRLVVCGRRSPPKRERGSSGEDAAFGRDFDSPQEAGLQICRPGDCLCLDAGGRVGGRSHPQLLPPCLETPSP